MISDSNSIQNEVITIIMATFNRASFIAESLASIQAQSFTKWKCLIVDDGGWDNTADIVNSFIREDNRFQYYRRGENYQKGISGCRNMGLDLNEGDYVIFFDDDDIIHPKNLEICLDLLNSTGRDFCRYNKKPFTGTFALQWSLPRKKEVISENVSKKNIDDIVMGHLAFASCTVLWHKRCFSNIRFNEDLQYAEEWECYTRIIASGFIGISINSVLYFNRKHQISNTGEFRSKDPVRMASKVRAVELVLINLKEENLLSKRLVKYFIQLGFSLKKPSIIENTLYHSGAGIYKVLKYRIGYRFYFILKPLLKLKGQVK